MSNFSELPIFIPKITDLAVFEEGFNLPAVLMDLHHTKWRPKVAEKVLESGMTFIVDPVTVRLLYPDAQDKKSFQELPYGDDIEPEDLYSNADDRLRKVIIPAVSSQLEVGSSIVIAPSFYSEDTNDTKFAVNLTLLSETVRYLENQSIDKPLYASIGIGRGVLLRPSVRNYVVDEYSNDLIKSRLAGYFVSVNDLDARKADIDLLLGFADLIFQLSKDKCVFVRHIGGFGEVLSAIGASGFSSGLAEGETFSIKNLESRPKGFGRGGGWTYVPEIFDYANDIELKKINYQCICGFCNGSFPKKAREKKLHFLKRRIDVIKALVPLDREERIQSVKKRLEEATKLVGNYIKQYGSPFKLEHLHKWITVLDAVKNWVHISEDDEGELSALLNELDSD